VWLLLLLLLLTSVVRRMLLLLLLLPMSYTLPLRAKPLRLLHASGSCWHCCCY
jgi:hypothetical protein